MILAEHSACWHFNETINVKTVSVFKQCSLYTHYSKHIRSHKIHRGRHFTLWLTSKSPFLISDMRGVATSISGMSQRVRTFRNIYRIRNLWNNSISVTTNR